MTRLVKSIINPTVGSSFLTVARTGTATRVNERGVMDVCSSNTPRMDYDPLTRACRGLMSEPVSRNLVLNSEDFSVGSAWTANNSPTRRAAAYTFGTLKLDLLGDLSATTAANYSQTIAFTGNAVKAISIFVKWSSTPGIFISLIDTTAVSDKLKCWISFPLSGVPGSVTTAAGTLLRTEDWGGGLYRLLFATTSVTAANTNVLSIYPAEENNPSLTGTGEAYFGGVQAEDTDFPTSYIPTTTTTVERGDEDFTEASVGSWLSPNQGTVVVSGTLNRVGAGSDSPALVSINDNTTSEEIQVYVTRSTGVPGFKVVDGGATQCDLTSGVVTERVPFTLAAAYQGSSFTVSVDGAAVVTDNSGTLPTVTRWRLGGNGAGGNRVNGWIRSFAYYRTKLLSGSVQSLASGGLPLTSVAPALAFDFTGAALEAQTGPLEKPRIAWNTYTRGLGAGSVIASSSDALFPSDAPLRPETYEAWKPTAVGATWRIDFGAALPVQYFLILGSGTKVAIEVSQDASVWTWIVGGVDLDLYPSGATLILVPTVSARHTRVTMESIGLMQAFMAGPILVMEKHVQMGYQPVNLSKVTEKSTSDSRSGQFLGTTIRRMGFNAPVLFQSLTPSWVRANLVPFIDSARVYPYGFAWNPAEFPEDVVYGRTPEDIAPRYMGDRPLMEVSWNIEGFDA